MEGGKVKTLRFLLFVGWWMTGIQPVVAGIGEPMPVYQPVLYGSAYEQTVLLNTLEGDKADALQLFLANAEGMDMEKERLYRSELQDFSGKLQKWQAKSRDEKAFLNRFFHAVHRRYLKKYAPFQGFAVLMQNGAYNCLSATALYALLLDELQISYQIYETDYHIFLMVETAKGEQILFETTDPLDGFVDRQEEIEQRIAAIRRDERSGNAVPARAYADFDLQVFRPVSLQQLAGLQYYNQAAYLYNTRRIEQATLALSKGRLLYQAERFDKLAGLLAVHQ